MAQISVTFAYLHKYTQNFYLTENYITNILVG